MNLDGWARGLVYEVHEESLGTDESVGMTQAQGVALLEAGLIVPRTIIHQFDVAPGADPARVRKELGL